MNVKLTKPQAEIFKSTAKATAGVAGFGSGKSQVSMIRMVASMMKYPKADMLYSAPTIPLIRDILWAKLDEFLPSIGLKHHVNKAESIVYIHGLGRIFCRSMDTPSRLVGFEVADAFMDELDILPTEKALEVFRKIKARCRQQVYDHTHTNKEKKKNRKKNQQFITTTPEGFKATYELFKKNPLPNSHLVQMSTYSNPYLPDDYIDDLRASYPKQLIEAYLLGEFVNLVALPVWGSFDAVHNSLAIPNKGKIKINKNININKISPIVIPNEALHIGSDFNVGRGCAVIYVKRNLPANHPASPYNEEHPGYIKPVTVEDFQARQNGWEIMVGVGEVFNSFDTPDTIRALNEKVPEDIFQNRIVYPDASGKARKSVNATVSDLSLIKAAGFSIKKRNKNPSIKDRVASGNAAFCNGFNHRRVYLDTDYVPNYVDSLIKQVYDNNGLPKKGESEFDDMTDAGTYPIYYNYPLKHIRMHERELRGV